MTFGGGAYDDSITLSDLFLLLHSSTRLSLTLGALTSTASAPQRISLRGAAVSRDWGMLLIVGRAPCRLDVGLHLCFKRFSEHLPDSVASDPVEAEHELFVGSRPGVSFSSV